MSGWHEERMLTPAEAGAMVTRVRAEIARHIVGQQRVVERVLVALLAGGHCLLEGAPGLGKTRLLTTLAGSLGGTFSRIQFTPDLLPSDIVGTRIWRQEEGRFSVELGPVFANFVLTDEINRAPAKVQSALLEVMAERQVTIGGTTYPAQRPFLVLATQNPIESEGVYQLPEAQRDRFLMKVPVDYPAGPHEELEIVRRAAGDVTEPTQVISLEDVRGLQAATRAIHVDPRVADYAVRLVLATRDPVRYGLDTLTNMIAYGASPRASIGLVEGARAMALLRGRGSVDAQDIYDIAYDVMNHRLVLSFDAVADGVTVDEVLYHLLTTVPAPQLSHSSGRPVAPSGPPPLPGLVPNGHAGAGGILVPAPVPGLSPEQRHQAMGPYGVSHVPGEFQGQRDARRGMGRPDGGSSSHLAPPVPDVLQPDWANPPPRTTDDTRDDEARDDEARDDGAFDDGAGDDGAGDDGAGDDGAGDDGARDDEAGDDEARDDEARDDEALYDEARDDEALYDEARDDEAGEDQDGEDQAFDDEAFDDEARADQAREDQAREGQARDDEVRDADVSDADRADHGGGPGEVRTFPVWSQPLPHGPPTDGSPQRAEGPLTPPA